jgi:hypothetical protein
MDPFLRITLPAGQHVLAIGADGLSEIDAKNGVNTDRNTLLCNCDGCEADEAAYQITLSSSTPIELVHPDLGTVVETPVCDKSSAEVVAASCPTSSSSSTSSEFSFW